MVRAPSNVERIRRPWSIRHLVRGLVVLGATVAGIVVAWILTAHGDPFTLDVGLVRGAALGALIGFGAAALVPLDREPTKLMVHPRPSGFEALRAEMEAERARAERARADAARAEAARADGAADPSARATDTDEVAHA